MSTITTRAGKGSPLTNNEVDANFTNLNTDKAELSGAAFTGAITTTSTVDGRDVATDGTKLDGIEASADVTDTTNVTAAGALMDSEVTNLAQVKAFDSADYATAAQGTTADAALPRTGGAMTGAITTNSTFDGRDVATDGTKLDGIEAGATADQTAAEIKTAYESNADTNAFTDADESKLDGIEASADVTDAINVEAAGALMDSELTAIASVKALNQGVATTDSPTFAGLTASGEITANGGIALGDNDKATFGAGDDLQIYHTGSYSAITDVGTGAFYIGGADFVDIGNSTLSETSARFHVNDRVDLYHNNAIKLATTSTGIDVTGTATADKVTIGTSSASNGKLTLEGVDGADSAGIYFNNTTATNGKSYSLSSGNSGEFMLYDRTSSAYRLFVSSAGSVGIGTSSPAANRSLHVSSAPQNQARFERTGASTVQIEFQDSTTTNQPSLGGDGDSLTFRTSFTERLRIASDGAATFNSTIAATSATFTTDDNLPQLTLVSTDADANAGPLIVLDRQSASPADGDSIGTIAFNGKNDAAEAHGYAKIEARIVDASNATEDGRLELMTSVATEEGISRILMNATETVINDNSKDLDFRVESDAQSHMFFVDAGASRATFGQAQASITSGGMYMDLSNDSQAHMGICVSENANNVAGLYINRQNYDGSVIIFRRNNTQRGSIEVTTVGTTYNTTSDRRLKNNIETITNGTDKLMAMNPVTHGWKADPEAGAVHGFIAQEMMDIVPEAVSGDPESDEMMSMDYGRITPVLVAALQDAHKKIEELETRLNELEGK